VTRKYIVQVPDVAYVDVNGSTSLSQAGCDYINALPAELREAATDEVFALESSGYLETSWGWSWHIDTRTKYGTRRYPTDEAAYKAARKDLWAWLSERRATVQGPGGVS
jgi:hypothetical protein